MIVRNDLKKTEAYKSAIKRYRKDVQLTYWAIMTIILIPFPISLLTEYLVSINFFPQFVLGLLYTQDGIYSGPFGLKNTIVFFALELIIAFFWYIWNKRNRFQVVEIFVSDKEKQFKRFSNNILFLSDNGKIFTIKDDYWYWEIENNKSYYFLCKKDKIFDIIKI